jgi:RNA recognition motif-containing protein
MNSKKKCNLFVRGFLETYDENRLREIFGLYGEIESIRILQVKEGQNTSRAFVCYKQPDCAALARAHLHRRLIDGSMLLVTNYEPPEVRN